MEQQQIVKSSNNKQDRINDMSKGELVEHIKSYFAKKAKEMLVLTILSAILCVLIVLSYLRGAEMETITMNLLIMAACGFSALIRYFIYKKPSKTNDADELLSIHDRLMSDELKWSRIGLAVLLLLFGFIIYVMIIEEGFSNLDTFEYFFLALSCLIFLFCAGYVFFPKIRRMLINSSNSYDIQYVQRLRELVEQEDEKNMVGV